MREAGSEPNTYLCTQGLFSPTKLQRDFTSQRFLAEQAGNHGFHRSEITACAPLDHLPGHSKLLGRSTPRPCLYRAQTSPRRAPRPPRRAPGLRGARRAQVGGNGCRGKHGRVCSGALRRGAASGPAGHRQPTKTSGRPKSGVRRLMSNFKESAGTLLPRPSGALGDRVPAAGSGGRWAGRVRELSGGPAPGARPGPAHRPAPPLARGQAPPPAPPSSPHSRAVGRAGAAAAGAAASSGHFAEERPGGGAA